MANGPGLSLMLHNSSAWDRGGMAEALAANGFEPTPWMEPKDFLGALIDSAFLFAPRGCGAAEFKYWECARRATRFCQHNCFAFIRLEA